jgi:hypothetical protein
MLEHDVELAKAALLYADQVEMVGLGVALFEQVRQSTGGELGMFGLLRSLDDEALAHVMGDSATRMPANFREVVDLLVEPRFRNMLRAAPSDSTGEMKQRLAEMDEINDGARPFVAALLEEAGAAELAVAIDARVIKVAKLDVDVSYLFRGQTRRRVETDAQVETWVNALLERLEDRRTRLLFDEPSAQLVDELLTNGRLQAFEPTLRLAREAAMGAGLIARLPAFPQAPMDELLNLRRDLTAPLVRYRGAVVSFSKDLSSAPGRDLEFEISQTWEERVAPAVTEVEQRLADHGLVRELFRSADTKDLTKFLWTSTASVGFAAATDVRAFLLGTVAATANLGVDATIQALRKRGEMLREVKGHELYYLFETNRRLAD